MHAPVVGLMGGVLAICSLGAIANEKPPEDYVDAMQSLRAVVLGLTTAIDSRDHEAMNEEVLAARLALEVVHSYWRDNGAEETGTALVAARAASKAISEISVSVHLLGISPNPVAIEGAQIALTSLREACASCHAAHRVEQPDGSYLIR